MTEAGDIALGGGAYPLVPGGYKRLPAHARAAGGQRIDVTGLGEGLLRPRGERGGFLGAAVGPTLERVGVEPWPHSRLHADAALAAAPLPNVGLLPSCVCGGTTYVGLGGRLYRFPPSTAPAWGDVTFVADCGQPITWLTPLRGEVIVGRGPWYDALRYVPSTGALATWRGGERMTWGVAYQGALITAPVMPAFGGNPGNEEQIRIGCTRYDGLAFTDERWIDAPVRRLLVHDGRVAILSATSVQLLGGRQFVGNAGDPRAFWQGDPEGGTTHGSYATFADLVFAESFKGRLYTWLGNRVVSWDGRGGSGAGWRNDGPSGITCWGGTVAAGWLIVALANRSYEGELWATDGDGGWWRVGRYDPSQPRIWPANAAGAGGVDVVAFLNQSSTVELYRLNDRGWPLGSLASAATWVSGLLDDGSPDTLKAWRRVGASFANPDGRAWGASPLTVRLDYSTDAGATWLEAAARTAGDPERRVWSLEATLPPETIARALQLRVAWEGVADWAPVLVGLSADYVAVPRPANRRRWEVVVRCSDRAVGRAGGALARDGRQLAADLWAAWEAGEPVSLLDVDHPATGQPRTVRIETLEETAAKPADQARWGETLVKLTLVEA